MSTAFAPTHDTPVRSTGREATIIPFPGRRRGGARLTRRGRVVVTLFFVGLFLVLGTVVASRVAATAAGGAPVETASVTVGAGDTLWDIASRYAEPGHTRDMIIAIQELNALPNATIQPGQVLAVPLR